LLQQKREIENKNDEISQQKRYLEKIYQDTTDSINYASRIQNVILPPENTLDNYFDGHFIYYRPKEIVSGDFYWFRYIERGNTRYFVIAAADSTGHGVPGSLVSMLGISLLNETVIRNEINTANQVLEKLRLEVKSTFRHFDDPQSTRDGIDIAFCIINLDTLEMQYSGANRPVLILKKDVEKGTDTELKGLIELLPVKNPVGMHYKEQPFINQFISLEKGDMLYLFSDGYADQVGGPEGRKFYYRRFKEMLAEIAVYPPAEQKQIIESRYQFWTNHLFKDAKKFRQVDDILVMGIRI
jgi:serine phosphatase RsbU (regulator of sigma subunit)